MQNIEFNAAADLIAYDDTMLAMEARVADIIDNKADELLWFVEHPPLYTAGTSSDIKDLLDADRFDVYQTGRGGEYTYHGPGQRVAYCMLNLKKRQTQDIKAYVKNLERWIINSLAALGVKGERRDGRVGIWVVLEDGTEAKIAAIGIRVRKWVTYHGIALNVNPNLSHFKGIVPCGISKHSVTSLKELGIDTTMKQVDEVLLDEFKKIFLLEK